MFKNGLFIFTRDLRQILHKYVKSCDRCKIYYEPNDLFSIRYQGSRYLGLQEHGAMCGSCAFENGVLCPVSDMYSNFAHNITK